jgi:Ser/Thr protein kinase RdoA (MazF antagonist)
MGSPAELSPAQVAALKEAASGAAVVSRAVTVKDGRVVEVLPVRENDTVLVMLTRVR